MPKYDYSSNNPNNVEIFLKNFKIFKENFITIDSISLEQKTRISIFLDFFPRKEKNLCDWVSTICSMILNDVTNYKGRIKRLMNLPASPSLYSCILRYGKTEGLKKYNSSSNSRTLHFPNRKQYWSNSLSDEEIEEKIYSIQQSRGLLASKKIKGTSEYSCRSKKYWLRLGYTEEEAAKQVRKVQSRKHSEERIEKWINLMNSKSMEEINLINKKKGHSIESIMLRGFSEEEARIIRNNFLKKRNSQSKISSELFDEINKEFPNNNFFYGSKNYEYDINSYYVDFYDPKTKIVIEFYGDFWHRNPMTYDRDFYIFGKYSNDVWNYDKKRQFNIENNDSVSNFYIIWESEYKNNKQEVIKNIINIIGENNNV